MLLIPIAQVDDTVRRQPWVSYALIAVNVVVAFAILGAFNPSELERRARFLGGQAVDTLATHPYLSIPPALTEYYLTEDGIDELKRLREEYERTRRLPAPAALQREQHELNKVVDAFVGALHDLPEFRFGYIPADRDYRRMLTSMFIHSGWLHLVGNMLFLFLTGPFLEDRYGRPLFLGLYLLSGFAAVNIHAMSTPDSTLPLVGASGAIAGVMGAFLVRLGYARIRFLFLPIPIIPAIRIPLILPAFVVLPAWLGEQILYAKHAGPESSTAWFAHIGGFLFGLVVAAAVRLMHLEEEFINPAIERETSFTQDASLEQAHEARTAGDYQAASREIRRALAEQPENIDAWAELFELSLARQDGGETARAMTRLIELYEKAGEHDLARRLVHDERWSRVASLPAPHFLAVAAFLEREGDGRGALDLYGLAVDRAPTSLTALRALVKQGEILVRGGDARAARRVYEQARAHPACSGAWPEVVDKALAQLPAIPVAPALPENEEDIYILGPQRADELPPNKR